MFPAFSCRKTTYGNSSTSAWSMFFLWTSHAWSFTPSDVSILVGEPVSECASERGGGGMFKLSTHHTSV